MKKALMVLLAVMTAVSLFVSCGNDPFYHEVKIKYEDKIVRTDLVYDASEYTLPKEVEGIPEISGWTYGEKEYAVGEKITVTSDITITAVVGTPVVITLYDDVTVTIFLKADETELTLPEAPERSGYAFDGWDVDGTTYASGAKVKYTEGMKITGVWTKVISITVDNGDGTTQTVTVRENATELTLPASRSREGYAFDCWNVDGTTYDAGAKVKYTEGMKITGVWKKIYTVTYLSNGGSGTVESDTFKEGSEGVTIKDGTGLTHESLSFSGWNTQADGEGKAYSVGDKYNENKDITLYAVWSSMVTVTYRSEGFDDYTAVRVPSEAASWDGTLPTGTKWSKAGYLLAGWYSEADGKGTYYTPSSAVANGDVLYAHWVDENLIFSLPVSTEGFYVTYDSKKRASVESVVIPSVFCGISVTAIESSAFSGASLLSSVTLPSSITQIDSNAFKGCVKLTQIELPESLTSIGTCAFSGCTSLRYITIPKNVTSISGDAFNNCTNLKNINLEIESSDAKKAGLDTSSTWGADNATVAWGVKSYKVGDTGPAGGIIIYVAADIQTSTYGTETLNWKYLEVAPSDASSGETTHVRYMWCEDTTYVALGTGKEIGDGWFNMQKLKGNISSYPAVKACADYYTEVEGVKYDDWFLPSMMELEEMKKNKTVVPSPADDAYWSSSQGDSTYCLVLYYVNFNEHITTGGSNSAGFEYVRPVRAFM